MSTLLLTKVYECEKNVLSWNSLKCSETLLLCIQPFSCPLLKIYIHCQIYIYIVCIGERIHELTLIYIQYRNFQQYTFGMHIL